MKIQPKTQKNQQNLLNDADPKDKSPIPLLTLFLLIFCLLLLLTRMITPAVVSGNSMNDTLQDKDYILVNRGVKVFNRNDVVVVKKESENYKIIKRIVGLPGEIVQIKDGNLYINGEICEDDTYGKEKMYYSGIAYDPIQLGEGEYFVLGDNRNNSEDSRYDKVGIVTDEELLGKAVIRLFPGIKKL